MKKEISILISKAIENLKIEARAVYFDSGKSTLKGIGTSALLDEMKEILKNYPNTKFSIEGHTDTDGSKAFNQKLSDDRANAVRNALIEKAMVTAKLNQLSAILISAQCHAINFYAKFGFQVTSDIYLDAEIPHRNMRLEF